MAAATANDYCVSKVSSEMVEPVLPRKEQRLPQSNLDLLIPPINVGVFCCYSRPNVRVPFSSASIVASLKKSLSEVLVSYYAFAARLAINSFGEPELLCNNQGVEFIEASADIELARVDFSKPDATVQGKLLPALYPSHYNDKEKLPVLCVQVTKFNCDSLVVGCTFDHRVADAYSTNMFLVSWAQKCRDAHGHGSSSSCPTPTIRRSLLQPRCPPRYDVTINEMYVNLSALATPKHKNVGNLALTAMVSRIYYLKSKDLEVIQNLANDNNDDDMGMKLKKRSKLESFCAYMWKMINTNMVLRGGGGITRCRLGVVVEGRSRLSNLYSTYFGNVLSIPFAEASVKEVNENPVSWSADLIQRFISEATNKEHFHSLIDWVEKQRPNVTLAKIFSDSSTPSVVVSSGLGFPISKIDFGWDMKFMLGSYFFPWGGLGRGQIGYVMPLPSPAKDGSWLVYLNLLKDDLLSMERHPQFILKPITPKYLGLEIEQP